MFVLAIDTSSPAVTAGIVTVPDATSALPDSVSAAADRVPLAARGHSELLSPSIDACLHDVGIAAGDVSAVVAGTGPGPFTGLRVGLVTAAAFADAVGAPLYGVCSLDALGNSCADEPALLVAGDARRHEVYWARYVHGARTAGPDVGRAADIDLEGITAVAGAGAELYADVWGPVLHRQERYPAPVALVRVALDRVIGRAPGETLTPLYLRRPDAVVPGAPKTVTTR